MSKVYTVYTAEEIARHNHVESLWIVIHGSVYDLTIFHKEHPGGEEVLRDLAGKDGTLCFDSIGHSDEAIMLRDVLKIGETEEDASLERPVRTAKSDAKSKESTMTQDEDWQSRKQNEEKERSPMLLIGAVIAVYALIIYYIWF